MFPNLRVLLPVVEGNSLTTRHMPGRAITSRVDRNWGPAEVLHGGVKGLSIGDFCAKISRSYERNLQFLHRLNRCIKPEISVKALDLHGNSLDFARSVREAFQELLPETP